MKIGCIDYLNCYPFYYHMYEKQRVDGVEVVPAIPSALNRMLGEGELDMSPISAAAYADMQKEVVLLPDFCLSSIGYVRSVILISTVPIEYLDGKKVGLSSASQTSVALLRVLLNRYYHVKPEYVSSPPFPLLDEIDAALVIGNDAMLPMKQQVPYIYDLGDLWMRHTGHPVVFAVFGVRREAAARDGRLIGEVVKSYHRSLDCLETERERLMKKAYEKYTALDYHDIDSYYHLLKFKFTPELKKALLFYFEAASGEGLMPPVTELEFLKFGV